MQRPGLPVLLSVKECGVVIQERNVVGARNAKRPGLKLSCTVYIGQCSAIVIRLDRPTIRPVSSGPSLLFGAIFLTIPVVSAFVMDVIYLCRGRH